MNLAQEKKFKMNSNYYDIYISYNSAQLEEGVTLICDYLRKWFKLNIWFDQDKHENNDSSYCEFDALQSSLIFICFPSKEYKKSIKNRIEYSIALKQEMRIIELRLFAVVTGIYCCFGGYWEVAEGCCGNGNLGAGAY